MAATDLLTKELTRRIEKLYLMQNTSQGHYRFGSSTLSNENRNQYIITCQNFANVARKSWFVLLFFLATFAFTSGFLIGYFSKSKICVTEREQQFKARIQTMLRAMNAEKMKESVRYSASYVSAWFGYKNLEFYNFNK